MDSVIYCRFRKSFAIYLSSEWIKKTKLLRYWKYEILCSLIPGYGDLSAKYVERYKYKGADKSLTRPEKTQTNVSVRMS